MSADLKVYPEYKAPGLRLKSKETSADILPTETKANGPLDNLPRGPIK